MRCGIFPGEGSEYAGMSELIASCDVNAIDIGFDVRDINAEVLEDRLDAQLAIYVSSTLLWDKFKDMMTFSLLAGHSLGFYAALYAAGVIDREGGIAIIKKAYTAIQEITVDIEGGMTAIIGLKWDIIDDICREISESSLANINSATQVVVSGTIDALRQVEKIADQKGALKIQRLNVKVPLHSHYLETIEDAMRANISELDFSRPRIPVVNHMAPEELTSVEKIKNVVCTQLEKRVRWQDAIIFMQKKDIGEYVEIGPSDVLGKLVKWIHRDATVFTSEDVLGGKAMHADKAESLNV